MKTTLLVMTWFASVFSLGFVLRFLQKLDELTKDQILYCSAHTVTFIILITLLMKNLVKNDTRPDTRSSS